MPRGPCAPKTVPVLGIGRVVLTVSQRLLHDLSSCRTINLTIEEGAPVIRATADGWAITRHPVGYTGLIKAPYLVKLANQHLGTGTKWRMEYDPEGRCWKGRPWEV